MSDATRRAMLAGMTATAAHLRLQPAAAQQAFPDRPIHIVIGFAPGGATDVAVRVIAAKMSEVLSQPVIIDNRSGASTSIAGEVVAKAEPDGYTLFTAGNANALNAAVQPNPPFDVLRDFTPVGLAVTAPSVLVVHPSLGIKSVDELIAASKKEPQKYFFATAGNGSVAHISGELFAHRTGAKLTSVAYKGSAQALTDLVAGRVPIMFAPVATALPFVQDGKLTPLAAVTQTRLRDLPEIPTLAEEGVKNVEVSIWFGLVAPNKTPPERIQTLARALDDAVKSDEVAAVLAKQGLSPLGGDGAEFSRRMGDEIARMRDLINATGLDLR